MKNLINKFPSLKQINKGSKIFTPRGYELLLADYFEELAKLQIEDYEEESFIGDYEEELIEIIDEIGLDDFREFVDAANLPKYFEGEDPKDEGEEVTLIVSYDGYMDSGGVSLYNAASLQKGLKKICEKHSYGLNDDEGNEIEKNPSARQILKRIDEMNGDGCDYIISIIQNDGTIIYRCDEFDEE